MNAHPENGYAYEYLKVFQGMLEDNLSILERIQYNLWHKPTSYLKRMAINSGFLSLPDDLEDHLGGDYDAYGFIPSHRGNIKDGETLQDQGHCFK